MIGWEIEYAYTVEEPLDEDRLAAVGLPRGRAVNRAMEALATLAALIAVVMIHAR